MDSIQVMSVESKLTNQELMKSVIQRIATGPELSKNISRKEAKESMSAILSGDISDVRSAIFLIALRMKRETTDENLGVHDAMIQSVKTIDTSTDNLVNIADPYDGFTRNIPSSAFILPVLAELGIPAISQGVETVGPKFGCTHHAVFKLHGLNVDASHDEVAERIENKKIGWGYIDQKIFSPELNNLMSLRTEIIKRPVVTTIEVLANPLISKKNHFVTGYVHKPYPPIYLNLAINAKFDTAMVIRGTEGGVIPSLRQKSNAHFYNSIEKGDEIIEINPEQDLGINQNLRAVAIPETVIKKTTHDKIETKVNPSDLARESLKLGMKALSGEEGPMLDCIMYGTALILNHVTNIGIKPSAKEVKNVLKSGSALNRFKQ